MIKSGQQILDTDFILSLTAGENLSANDSCYISASDGKVYKTDADDSTKIGFVGFAQEAATTNNTVRVVYDGHMGGFSSLTIGAIYYVSGTAGGITLTAPTLAKRVGRAITATIIKIDTEPSKRVSVYSTADADLGSSTTRFDITNPAGTTFRYTFDGTGTDPNFSLANNPVGSTIVFDAQNFSAGNNGVFVVTGAGANYVEVTNASGVAENDKTIGTGSVRKGQVFTKLPSATIIEIELVGGGANADTNEAGASGGYLRKKFEAAALASSEPLVVGAVSRYTAFGATASSYALKGGGAVTTTKGTATGGDINIDGQDGQSSQTITKPSTSSTNYIGGDGGSTPLGAGGKGTRNSGSPGSMGSGQNGQGYGSGGGVASGSGKQGILIITEYF